MVTYLSGLTIPRIVLWCYLIWYLVIAARYFDPSPRLWLTSLGLGLIVGTALLLNAGIGRDHPLDRWSAFRFLVIPFCVSSFAALVKGKGFILVFSPHLTDVALGAAICSAFVGMVLGARMMRPTGVARNRTPPPRIP